MNVHRPQLSTVYNPEGFESESLSVCLYVCVDRDSDVGLYDPAAVCGPVVTPQTQEIPLLLLHGSVVAACLCVYFCGTDPVCMCQCRTGFFRRGVTVLPGQPTNPSSDRSPEGRTQEKLNKHNHSLFLRTLPDTPIGWPTWQRFFLLVPLHPPFCSSLWRFGLWTLTPRKLSKGTRREAMLLSGMSWFGSLFLLHYCPLWPLYRPFSLFGEWESEV